MNTGAEIPMTAWQQAAVVVLFCLFVLSLFAFVRWLLKWVSEMQSEWQEFMHDREKVWQAWLERQSLQSNQALSEVTQALKELACEIREHDAKVEDRISNAVKQVKTPPRKA